MTTKIEVTAGQLNEMGWTIDPQDQAVDNFILSICNDPERRKISLSLIAANGEEVELPEYSFEYWPTLSDLDDFGLLPDFLNGYDYVMYNDDENQVSSHVRAGDVSEIIGDIDRLELKLYKSFAELNADLSNCSFGEPGEEPAY